MTIETARLELIAATVEIARAEIHDRARFAALLGTPVPEAWPPPLNDDASMQWLLRALECDPDALGWCAWYIVLRGGSHAGRVVIGNGGFTGRPNAGGTVEIGYSILEAYQGHGYATEAVQGLLAWAFGRAEVQRVIAQTFPNLTRSIRVLEKCGFRATGPGSDEGALGFELKRDKPVGGAPRLP